MITAILLAAGVGSRMGQGPLPKQFLCVGGVPILAHTLIRFERTAAIDQIVLVTRPQDRAQCEQILVEYQIAKISMIVAGGKERQDSVWQGLQAVHPQTKIVLIHDVARMFVTATIITDVIEAAHKHCACVTAVPVQRYDTNALNGIIIAIQNDSANGSIIPLQKNSSSSKPLIRGVFNGRFTRRKPFKYPFIRAIFTKRHGKLDFTATDDAMLAEYISAIRSTLFTALIATSNHYL
jgi:CTP:molybdopterin cytidylyltransferase MocA